jgi:hypothetical protein
MNVRSGLGMSRVFEGKKFLMFAKEIICGVHSIGLGQKPVATPGDSYKPSGSINEQKLIKKTTSF